VSQPGESDKASSRKLAGKPPPILHRDNVVFLSPNNECRKKECTKAAGGKLPCAEIDRAGSPEQGSPAFAGEVRRALRQSLLFVNRIRTEDNRLQPPTDRPEWWRCEEKEFTDPSSAS